MKTLWNRKLWRPLLSLACVLALLSGCAAASSESEVMVDTSAKTKKHVPGGLPGDTDPSPLAESLGN
jgi:hypothetical protein